MRCQGAEPQSRRKHGTADAFGQPAKIVRKAGVTRGPISPLRLVALVELDDFHGNFVGQQSRRSQVRSGDRSEKIRTYNFPENRVTDHRVHLSLYRLREVLEGDLDEFFEALAIADRAERLAAQD